MAVNQELQDKIKKVKLVILDVDGVLTDGKIIYSSYGSDSKEFDVRDGFGVKLLFRAGIPSVILTARASRVVRRRAKDMHIARIYLNAFKKLPVYEKILERFNVSDEEVCFIGDDLVDLPVLRRVGFSVAVSDAINELKEQVDYVTKKKGGRGAVREVADLILKLQDKWNSVTRRYYQ